MSEQSFELALEAGLSYVEPNAPGFRRVRRGRGFSYVTEGGDVVRGASSLVLGELARASGDGDIDDRIRGAVDAAAKRLGNTRAVCRDSYVHPLVFAAAEDDLIDRYWARSRSGRWLNREESALRKLLDEED